MARLIDGLIAEHKILLQVLEQVKNLGISSEEGRKLLLDAQDTFLFHLKKEDDELYPVLQAAAREDAQLKQVLATFAQEMDKITENAMDFFKKYATGEGKGLEFARDFGTLYATFRQRLRKEETGLYAVYEKLTV